MWRRALSWIILLTLCAVVSLFAIANRRMVEIDFDPLPLVLQLPLYAALLGTLAAGLILGWIMAWTSQSHWRRLARQRNRELKRLHAIYPDAEHPPRQPVGRFHFVDRLKLKKAFLPQRPATTESETSSRKNSSITSGSLASNRGDGDPRPPDG